MVASLELEALAKYPNRLAAILNYLQREHRIAILLFMHDREITRWRDAKKAGICNDGTFRRACVQLTLIGLAERIPLDAEGTRNHFRLTDLGCVVGDIVKRAVRDIKILVNPEKVIAQKIG